MRLEVKHFHCRPQSADTPRFVAAHLIKRKKAVGAVNNGRGLVVGRLAIRRVGIAEKIEILPIDVLHDGNHLVVI